MVDEGLFAALPEQKKPQPQAIDDHKVYQEVQGRRTIPLLQAYDYPYRIIDKEVEIESIPDAYEWHRLQKRPFVLFLTKKLLGTAA